MSTCRRMQRNPYVPPFTELSLAQMDQRPQHKSRYTELDGRESGT